VQVDVVVIGGGAAGLFCALTAGRRGRRVVVLEHNERVGKKIRISGGGRCNFTNLNTTPANFLSANPHFCKSALARYTPQDFVAEVERHGIAYYEKTLGQLFCTGSAQQIIDLLVTECARANVQIICQCQVLSLTQSAPFTVTTNRGDFNAASVVIATGGLSLPTLGSTDFGYRIARQFGLKLQPPRAALVPLVMTAEPHGPLSALSGVSFPAAVSCGDAEFSEAVLLTHRGLSGPAILQASSYWRPGDEVVINLLPSQSARDLLQAHRQSDSELANLLAQYLPRRLAQTWCALYAPSRPLKQFSEAELIEVADRIARWTLRPIGTEGYRKAEVTAGGVDTDELSSKTMAARRVPGLYFIGEVVDVTGHLGGYNFQWAWASGYAAGQYV
jgi:predicted Rossmann fold flavoprotein